MPPVLHETLEGTPNEHASLDMMDPQHLDWIEKAAIENLRGRLATGDALLAQTSTFLSILLVGVGGSLAYAVKLAENARAAPFAVGISVVVLWLSVVAGVLVWKCQMTRATQMLFNEPNNLRPSDQNLTLEELRLFELENIQGRIDRTKERNEDVARWLDICRAAAIATPLPFIAGACIAAYL